MITDGGKEEPAILLKQSFLQVCARWCTPIQVLLLSRKGCVFRQIAVRIVISNKMCHALPFCKKLILTLLDSLVQVTVNLKVWYNLIVSIPFRPARHTKNELIGNPIWISCGEYSWWEPVTFWSRGDKRLDSICDWHSSRCSWGSAPLLDQCPSSCLYPWCKLLLQPLVVCNHISCWLSINSSIQKIRHLCCWVVAPDGDIRDIVIEHTCLEGQLTFCPVFIQPGECMEILAGDTRCIFESNECICVARIPNYKHLHIRTCNSIQCLPLLSKDLPIKVKQVCPLHSGIPRLGPDEQSPVHIPENFNGVSANVNFPKQRKQTILQLHPHTFKRISWFLWPQEV